ncbi:hypothetical protein C8J57DRAFT_690635 [Mycena rebaudengoi]|nr:hypothetical protein C8J57DRAFT_690635 [Mycena rebaudengoi]
MYSHIPFELAAEIASHNARDLDTLRAMTLTSSSMRSFAIPFLFAAIRFPWSETGEFWAELLESIPDLPTTTKTVHFRWPSNLLNAEVAHAAIPLMPHVRTVHWSIDCGSDSPIYKALNVADASLCLSKFPNMAELHIDGAVFVELTSIAQFLGSCGALSALYLFQGGVVRETALPFDRSAHGRPTLFDLSALETLDVQNGNGNYVINLLEHSPPRALKSLTLGACSPGTTRKLFALGSRTLERLLVYPFNDLPQIMDGLPPLGALHSLVICLLKEPPVQHAIGTIGTLSTFPAAPNLTTITLQIRVGVDYAGYTLETVDAPSATLHGTERLPQSEILAETMGKLREALPEDWARARFPRLEQLKFQLCVPMAHASAGITTRELAFYETMEGVVIQHFPRALVQWLDWEYNVIRGGKGTGWCGWKGLRGARGLVRYGRRSCLS